MKKTEELLKLAEARTVRFDFGTHATTINSAAIKHLIELVKLQHEVLTRVGRDQYPVIEKAITAFEKFENGR